MAGLYPDSKTFVDKKLKQSPGKIIKKFEELVKQNNGQALSKEQIQAFVDDHFDAEGLELELWTPSDWTPEPAFVHKLQNAQLRGLAKRINRLWRDLSRRIKDDVKDNPSLYSIIYVPNGFVVPGGRFREFYYWDTYWIVRPCCGSTCTPPSGGCWRTSCSWCPRTVLCPTAAVCTTPRGASRPSSP